MQGARRRSNARSIRRGVATTQLGTFRANPSGRCFAGPAAAAALRKQRSAGGPTIALSCLASLRPRFARSPALLRALRIVRLFVCGSRRASHPAKQRRGPMGFCISLLGSKALPQRTQRETDSLTNTGHWYRQRYFTYTSARKKESPLLGVLCVLCGEAVCFFQITAIPIHRQLQCYFFRFSSASPAARFV